MKYYTTIHPSETEPTGYTEEIVSERDIITEYFDRWSEGMAKAGKQNLISYERCIEDWVMVNWAEEVK